MDEPGAEIEKLRREIDDIDTQIVDRLNERARLARRIRELKETLHMPVFDPEREEEILRRLVRDNDGPMGPEALREIYETILRWMKGQD